MLGEIKIVIDPEAFEAETGEPLSDELLELLGAIVNDEVACYTMGYSGWQAGWCLTPEEMNRAL